MCLELVFLVEVCVCAQGGVGGGSALLPMASRCTGTPSIFTFYGWEEEGGVAMNPVRPSAAVPTLETTPVIPSSLALDFGRFK